MERKLTVKEKLLLKSKEQKKKNTKQVFIALGIVVILLSTLLILRNPVQAKVTKDPNTTFTATFVGNMNFGKNVEKITKTHGYYYLFKNVQPYLSASDYVSGHYKPLAVTKNTMQGLKNANFTISNPVADQISYTEKNGLKIATLTLGDVPGKLDSMLSLVKEAKGNANLVFVHMNWGKTFASEPSPRMKDLAKALSNAGADVIVGNTSHVLSSVDVYNNTVILYGLGNFISSEGWTKTKESVLAQYHLSKTGEVKVELLPLRISDSHPDLIGPMGGFYQQKIFNQLTRYSTNPKAWRVENNTLVFKFQKL